MWRRENTKSILERQGNAPESSSFHALWFITPTRRGGVKFSLQYGLCVEASLSKLHIVACQPLLCLSTRCQQCYRRLMGGWHCIPSKILRNCIGKAAPAPITLHSLHWKTAESMGHPVPHQLWFQDNIRVKFRYTTTDQVRATGQQRTISQPPSCWPHWPTHSPTHPQSTSAGNSP